MGKRAHGDIVVGHASAASRTRTSESDSGESLSSGSTQPLESDNESTWTPEEQSRCVKSAKSSPGHFPGRERRKWSTEEDNRLKAVLAVLKKGGKEVAGPSVGGLLTSERQRISWALVAKQMKTRSAKQCRDRWNSICPGIKKKEWTVEEDEKLLKFYRVYKNQWVKIATHFKDRNDNMLKSRFRSLLKRKEIRQMIKAQKLADEHSIDSFEPAIPPPLPHEMEQPQSWMEPLFLMEPLQFEWVLDPAVQTSTTRMPTDQELAAWISTEF